MQKQTVMNYIMNPAILIFTLATAAGVVLHDTQLDKATAMVIALPVTTIALYGAVDGVRTGDAHVHVERTGAPNHISTLRAMVPRIQPRDDDRREIHGKRTVFYSGGGDTSLWPSI